MQPPPEPGIEIQLCTTRASPWRHRSFVETLHENFRERGADAIRVCRIEDPTAYLKVIASILPRELVVESAAADLSDEELEAMIANLKAQMLEAAREQPLARISHAS
jgi:hypothetical protein